MSTKPPQYNDAVVWFIEMIRRRALDHPKHNDLTRNYDLDAEDIKTYMQNTIVDFNEMEPTDIGGYTILNFPSQEILILGVLHKAYKALADMHERNEMPFNAEGVSANRHAVGKSLQSIAADYFQKYESKAAEKKVALNAMSIMRGARGASSAYGILSWYNTRI